MYLCIYVICICIDHSYILSHLSLPFSISLSLSLRSHTLLNLPFFSLSLLTIRFFFLFTLLYFLIYLFWFEINNIPILCTLHSKRG
ncbi:hypothetical protein J3Q64DRAFT_1744146, partial [Phycomyces blakesleeanus]